MDWTSSGSSWILLGVAGVGVASKLLSTPVPASGGPAGARGTVVASRAEAEESPGFGWEDPRHFLQGDGVRRVIDAGGGLVLELRSEADAQTFANLERGAQLGTARALRALKREGLVRDCRPSEAVEVYLGYHFYLPTDSGIPVEVERGTAGLYLYRSEGGRVMHHVIALGSLPGQQQISVMMHEVAHYWYAQRCAEGRMRLSSEAFAESIEADAPLPAGGGSVAAKPPSGWYAALVAAEAADAAAQRAAPGGAPAGEGGGAAVQIDIVTVGGASGPGLSSGRRQRRCARRGGC